jgi:hypothetical protein
MSDYLDPANHVFQKDTDEGKDPAACALCSLPEAVHPEDDPIVYSPTQACRCGEVHPT